MATGGNGGGYSLGPRQDYSYSSSGQLGMEESTHFGTSGTYGAASEYGAYSTYDSQRSTVHSTLPSSKVTELDNQGYSEDVASTCNDLKELWHNENVTSFIFKERWDEAYEKGLVPFSHDEMAFEQIGKYTTYSPKGDHTDFNQILYKKLSDLDPSSNTYVRYSSSQKPLRETQKDCGKLLRFMAYAEANEECQFWRSGIEDLNGSGKGRGQSIFDYDSFSYEYISGELAEIDQKARFSGAGATGGLQFEMNSPGAPAMDEASSQSEFLGSLNSSLSIPLSSSRSFTLFRSAVKAPVLSEEVEQFMDSTQDCYKYNYRPGEKFGRSKDLFTPQYKQDQLSFRKNVENMINAKLSNVNREFCEKFVNLHFACKVLERDIPHSRDVDRVEQARVTQTEAQSWPQIPSDLEEEIQSVLGDSKIMARYGMAQDNLSYASELRKALEEKASRLNIPVLTLDLPEYPQN